MTVIANPGASSYLPATYTAVDATAALDTEQGDMSRLEQQISSGVKFSKPSDDPSGVVAAMRLSSALSRSQTYSATLTSATAMVQQANGALTSVQTQMQQLRQTLLQASDVSNQTPAAMQVFAAQVQSIATTIGSLASQTYQGEPLFGSDQQYRTVAPGQSVAVGVTATDAFGDATTGLQATLATIVTQLSDGSFATGGNGQAAVAAVDTANDRLTQAAVTVGVQSQSLSTFQTQATSAQTSLTQQLSAVQDTDLASTVTALQQEQNDYQASLWATSQILSPSLVRFLS